MLQNYTRNTVWKLMVQSQRVYIGKERVTTQQGGGYTTAVRTNLSYNCNKGKVAVPKESRWFDK